MVACNFTIRCIASGDKMPLLLSKPDALHLPVIPGITYRNFRGPSDFTGMIEVANACSKNDGVEETLSIADLANEYAHLKNCDPQTDMLMVEADGHLVAYGGIQWRDDDESNRIYEQEVQVHPDARALGLQRLLYRFNQTRAQELAVAGLATGFGQPQFLSAWIYDSAGAETALLRDMGYTAVRHFSEMRHDLQNIPSAPFPRGIELRPVQNPNHLRTIWNAKEEAFADHWGHVHRGDEGFREWCADPVFEHHLWQVAWEQASDELVGLSVNTIYHNDNADFGFKRGWIDTLCVRRAWRGKGIARALIAASLHTLKKQGMTEVLLGVDSGNTTGALQLHEHMGFVTFRRNTVWRMKIA